MATIVKIEIEGGLKVSRVEPLDLTRADLWAEDHWQEPMRELRAKGRVRWNDGSKFGPH